MTFMKYCWFSSKDVLGFLWLWAEVSCLQSHSRKRGRYVGEFLLYSSYVNIRVTSKPSSKNSIIVAVRIHVTQISYVSHKTFQFSETEGHMLQAPPARDKQ